MTIASSVFVSVALLTFARPGAETGPRPTTPSGLSIPKPLQIEHDELHEDLVKATNLRGATGEAAQHVADLLHQHFEKEEEFALPPLGLLQQLAEGKEIPDATAVLKITEKLKAELPQMLAEHKAIVAALDDLGAAATKQGHPEVLRFAEKLKIHAQTEEQVLYPASILVGEYLKARSHR